MFVLLAVIAASTTEVSYHMARLIHYCRVYLGYSSFLLCTTLLLRALHQVWVPTRRLTDAWEEYDNLTIDVSFIDKTLVGQEPQGGLKPWVRLLPTINGRPGGIVFCFIVLMHCLR